MIFGLPKEIQELDVAVTKEADTLDLEAYKAIKEAYEAEINRLQVINYDLAGKYIKLEKKKGYSQQLSAMTRDRNKWKEKYEQLKDEVNQRAA